MTADVLRMLPGVIAVVPWPFKQGHLCWILVCGLKGVSTVGSNRCLHHDNGTGDGRMRLALMRAGGLTKAGTMGILVLQVKVAVSVRDCVRRPMAMGSEWGYVGLPAYGCTVRY